MIKFSPPCDMKLAYFGDSWQDHCNRAGYLAGGNEPGQDIISRPQANIRLDAVMDGVISRDKDIGYNMGFGTYCEIDHGVLADGHHYRTLCAHEASNGVSSSCIPGSQSTIRSSVLLLVEWRASWKAIR